MPEIRVLSIEQIVSVFVALIAIVGILLGSLKGHEGSSSAAGSSGPAPTTAAPTTAAPTATRASDTPPRDDIQFESLGVWDHWERVAGHPNQIRIFYTSGNRGCHGEYATVTETERSVVVDLYKGMLPNSTVACTTEAIGVSMVITLQRPLGDRTVSQTGGYKPGGQPIPIPSVPTTLVTE